MVSDELLSRDQVQAQLKSLAAWQLDPNEAVIVGRFEFADFPAAIHFVNRVAGAAETLNHHPDMDIRYRNVVLRATTHRVDGLTNLDLELARVSQALAGK